ncbi:MAG TPA: exo-beta-N-acetylmuramidase NamZ domain-containing protein, partial [Vulgatibacter sp.]
MRVGAICNPTSVDRSFVHLADRLAAAEGVTLAALFGPEHGIRGTAQDMIHVEGEQVDARTGVPVHSLYGATFDSLMPTPQMLEGLDALVFDIQDV